MSDNLKVWNALKPTDPKQTKPFKRAGGFKGTAVKPIYTLQKMTEQFGPIGEGWGTTEPVYQVVPGHNGEVLVYCTVGMWTGDSGKLFYGVGGDKVVTYLRANDEYNRPERWENNDEAFKAAFTDAVGNAMKHLGMSADVHMGLFDDSKYVREREEEERPRQPSGSSEPRVAPTSSPLLQDRVEKGSGPSGGPASAGGDTATVYARLWTKMETLDGDALIKWQNRPEVAEAFKGLPEKERLNLNDAINQKLGK
jgi:hypothetical protein